MNDNRPFDLARLDTEGRRKRLRKKLLLYSLPIILLLVPIAIKLVSLSLTTSVATAHYDTMRYKDSSRAFSQLLWLNVLEPYKAQYNYGTSLVMARDYEGAQVALEKALLDAPIEHECLVRLNLVHAYKLPADQALADKEYEQAIVLYDKVKAVIDARDCGIRYENGQMIATDASDDTKEASEKMDEHYSDAQDKQAEAKRAQNGDPSDDTPQQNEAGQAESSKIPSEEQQQQLQDQQQQADQEARRLRETDRYLDQDNQEFYNGKQW